MHSAVHCHDILADCLLVTKHVNMWGCGVRTVGCMWEHSPWKFCAGLSGMHTALWSGGMEKQLFWDSSCDALRDGENLDLLVLKCSGHSSLVLLWKGHKNNTFLIPHDFSFWRRTLEFLLLWEKHAVPFHRLPFEVEFKLMDPSFFTLDSSQQHKPSSTLHGCKRSVVTALLVSLNAPVSIYDTPLSPTLA